MASRTIPSILPPRVEPPITQDSTLPPELVALRDTLAGHAGIVAQAGAARILGVSATAIRRRFDRGTMPEPITWDDQMRPMWLVSQIMDLATKGQ